MTTVKKRNRRVVIILLAAVVGMSAFAFVLIPIYRLMSNVYGFGGDNQQPDKAQLAARKAHALRNGMDSTRTISLQFLVIDNNALQVEFRPMQSQMDVHPGELKAVRYYLHNLSQHELVLQGRQSVTPGMAARYLVCMGSLCGKRIVLRAGETRMLPVKFVIDPDIPGKLQVLTLSYHLIMRKQVNAASNNSLYGPVASANTALVN